MAELAGDDVVGEATGIVEVVEGVDWLALLVETGVEEVVGIVT